MFQISARETYQNGQVIFAEGSAEDLIYTIESGSIELYKKVGDEMVVVEVLHPGDILGELAFLAKIPRTVSAKAAGTTTVEVIDRVLLDEEFNRLSSSFQMLLKNLGLRLERAIEKSVQPKLRRKDPRVPKVLALTLKSGAALAKTFSGDISVGGLFIKTDKPLAPGEYFTLKLQLPYTFDVLTIECKVAWNRTKTDDLIQQQLGMGVQFINISPEDRTTLREEIVKAEASSE